MGDEQKRAFWAIALSGLILVLWQYFFAPKVTPVPTSPVAIEEVQGEKGGKIEDSPVVNEVSPAAQAVSQVHLNSEAVKLTLNSNLAFAGLVTNWSNYNLQEVSGRDFPLKILINKKEQEFLFDQSNPEKLVATKDGMKITFSLTKNDAVAIEAEGLKDKTLTFRFSGKVAEDAHVPRSYVYFTDELNKFDLDDEEKDSGKTQIAGIDFNYHLLAVVFPTPVQASLTVDLSAFEVSTVVDSDLFSAEILLLKKDYDRLASLGNNLSNTVDFGIFSILAVPILRMLQFFYTVIPNYGVAVILLTLVIRLVTFPLQFKSLKSMKKMQKIQPELQKMREKFKDDPVRMQKESMDLFKRSGANPISGCFPLLLQMPIFLAFYQVLSHAVELVGAPFIFWITDLSIKDPFYVLPVLMTIAMFVQQKITPTTITDPVQQKVMLFMPLVIGFIMKDLASGLNLYIFVSTLFGIIQQIVVFNRIKE